MARRKHQTTAEIDLWFAENDGKHKCQCGCGGMIRLRRIHKRRGVPKYLPAHLFKDPNGFKFKNIQGWVDANQDKHFCKCGCGAAITIKYAHRYGRGIPDYVERSHWKRHWIAERQGKYLCQCGCGRPIPIRIEHKSLGIPRFLRHHAKAAMAKRPKWIKENQGKHICACGCGQLIKITRWIWPRKIPKYIPGHTKGLPLKLWVKREQGKHHCACGCGKPIPLRPEHRKHGIPNYILGHNSQGVMNPAWKGGITPAYNRQRVAGATALSNWRQSVLDRDDRGCQMPWCTSHRRRKVTLHAHHIIGFNKNPRLRLRVWNGITMCEQCHLEFKGREEENETFFFALLGRKHPYGRAI